MATSNLFLNFGKKIYKTTKPALPNNPSHLLALLHVAFMNINSANEIVMVMLDMRLAPSNAVRGVVYEERKDGDQGF
jgi:hypothetical protein